MGERHSARVGKVEIGRGFQEESARVWKAKVGRESAKEYNDRGTSGGGWGCLLVKASRNWACCKLRVFNRRAPQELDRCPYGLPLSETHFLKSDVSKCAFARSEVPDVRFRQNLGKHQKNTLAIQ